MMGELVETVTHRLFARDGRQRAEDDRKEPRWPIILAQGAPHAIGARIDIDDPAVDFALGGTLGEEGDDLFERRIVEHRSVDQGDPIEMAGTRMGRKELA